MKDVIKNLEMVKNNITKSAEESGRDPRDIKLIIVTKKFTQDSIKPLLDIGHLTFGENRVKEAINKWPDLMDSYKDVELHMLGNLQSNKVKDALTIFSSIHTVDRVKLIEKILKNSGENDLPNELFIQLNLAKELGKNGIYPERLPGLLKELQKDITLKIDGLMCIPPKDEEPSLYFALLRKLSEENKIRNLSMGMSRDYKKAVEFGATHIRVGEAIMGSREDVQ